MTRVEINRDQWGRPRLPDPVNGRLRSYTRATTLANTIQDRFALEQWSRRNLVKGFVANEDLLLRAAAAGDDRDKLNEILVAADDAAAASRAADRGTAVHAITEQIDMGESVIVPRDYQPDIKAYTRCLQENAIKIEREWVETMLVCPDLDAAGTPDRLVHCPLSSKLVVFDLKTGANALKYSQVEIAAQLTIYAWSDWFYDGSLCEMPPVERNFALVLHLPVGTGEATLYEVDLIKGKMIAQLCYQARKARKTEGLFRPFNRPYTEDEVRRRIELIKDALGNDPLPLEWPDGVLTPKRQGDDPYPAEHVAAIGMWCHLVETKLDLVPF